MTEELTKTWVKGCNDGQNIVLEFLKEMKGLDFKEEFEAWANADEYQNINGETIKRYASHAVRETEDKDE